MPYLEDVLVPPMDDSSPAPNRLFLWRTAHSLVDRDSVAAEGLRHIAAEEARCGGQISAAGARLREGTHGFRSVCRAADPLGLNRPVVNDAPEGSPDAP